jgi:3D (Asp-Asp-Asp) domain-containing protein
MSTLLQKIQAKRAEINERITVGKLNAKEKAKSGWMQLKDFILILYLLNTMIGQFEKIDIMEAWNGASVSAHVIDIPHEPKTVGQVAVDENPIATPDDQVEELKGVWTAYNSEAGQTDADPLTMASGKKVYDGAIANNCLPFGTKVKVNGKVKVVEDRMNSRYGCEYFDIFMQSYDEAIKFGKKELTYEIIK